MSPRPAIFVASRHALADSPGGQQLCTREYIAVLEAAGFDLHIVKFTPENRLRAKILRRLTNRPYRHFVPAGLELTVRDACQQTGSETIFLNVVDLAPLAAPVKRLLPNTRIVLLSHGLESVDYLHELRSRVPSREFGALKRSDEVRLARQLVAECEHRRHIDDVLCLAPFEAGIEQWLGAGRVMPVPRTVTADFLPWKPVENRVGFVGRIDHPPNLEGLRAFLSEAQRHGAGCRVRVVGMPEAAGHRLAEQYRLVEYLGSLSDQELRTEAATWSCFLHPIFCYARGASTKLAVGLGWGIPVVTTPAGCRGYEWSCGGVTMSTTPAEFAQATAVLASNPAEREQAARNVRMLVESTPGVDEIAQRVSVFLSDGAPAAHGVGDASVCPREADSGRSADVERTVAWR